VRKSGKFLGSNGKREETLLPTFLLIINYLVKNEKNKKSAHTHHMHLQGLNQMAQQSHSNMFIFVAYFLPCYATDLNVLYFGYNPFFVRRRNQQMGTLC
jgi:hypothetical protein